MARTGYYQNFFLKFAELMTENNISLVCLIYVALSFSLEEQLLDVNLRLFTYYLFKLFVYFYLCHIPFYYQFEGAICMLVILSRMFTITYSLDLFFIFIFKVTLAVQKP